MTRTFELAGVYLILLTGVGFAAESVDSKPSDPLRFVEVSRPRVIIETDAGGDPDDEQSLVRFLLYANDLDIEGIIANRPNAREGENRNPVRDGLGIVQSMIAAYGECLPNLQQHDPRYPSSEQLLSRTVAGYGTDAGVDLVIAAVDREDDRPVWFLNWGTDNGAAPSCLKRALDRVLASRGPDGYARFKNHIRLCSYDKFGDHTSLAPPWKLWVQPFQPEVDGWRWYHCFSKITATAGGFDVERDVRHDHGPLGAMYPTNTTHPQKEGDTMTFLYLVPTGMNDPRHPDWGSWAGRYALREDFPGLPYYWASAEDTWHGSTHRENSLRRWAADLQNDFRARLDWCVESFDQANHPPQVAVEENTTGAILHLSAAPGMEVSLTADGTSDPDGDDLYFDWFTYPETGTYSGEVDIESSQTPQARLAIPSDASGKTLHVGLKVQDNGTPPLTRYRRCVIEIGS